MTTIDKLDISVYSNYALRITLIEQINSQLRMTEAASIPPQLQVVDISPKLSEMDLVLGIAQAAVPWAYFYPPPRFRDVRRNPFAFYRIAPILGSLEKEEENEQKMNQQPCETAQEEEEKAAITSCIKQIGKINDMINYIVGRIGQFLQG